MIKVKLFNKKAGMIKTGTFPRSIEHFLCLCYLFVWKLWKVIHGNTEKIKPVDLELISDLFQMILESYSLFNNIDKLNTALSCFLQERPVS